MKYLLIFIVSYILIGCTGAITGHEYKLQDAKIVYQVVNGGVTTFMTAQQITDLKLDKANDVVIKAYKLTEGNDAPTQ